MKYEPNLIHYFQMDDDYIVLDINSGLIHQVSPLVIEVIQQWENNGCDLVAVPALPVWQNREDVDLSEVAEIVAELNELAEAGGFMSKAPELDNYVMPEDYVVKALCLHVAHDCNLRCQYCFADGGAFGGDRTIMDFATGKKALDFLFKASGKRKHIEVDYFGGEPLMNFAVVKKLIEYGRDESKRLGKVLKQTLTTNGVLLEGEILDFLNQEDVALVLSLDGRKSCHDRMRPAANGKGSYDVVLPKLKVAVASRNFDNYYLRGTFTRYNCDFFEDVKHLLEEGFDLLSEEPVVTSPDKPYALTKEDLPVLYEQYEKLARFYVQRRQEGKPFLFFHFNLDLDRGPCLPKRLSGCGAGHEYLAVAPDGSLYPCHQFVGQPEFKVGHVDTGVEKPEIGRAFRETHALAKEECRQCWARFYCSGGCHANAWHANQDIKKPYEMGCLLEKKRLECAIWIQTKLAPAES